MLLPPGAECLLQNIWGWAATEMVSGLYLKSRASQMCMPAFGQCVFTVCELQLLLGSFASLPVHPRGSPFFFFLDTFKIHIYLAVPGLSCSMWDLVSVRGIEPGPPALGVQSLLCWLLSIHIQALAPPEPET